MFLIVCLWWLLLLSLLVWDLVVVLVLDACWVWSNGQVALLLFPDCWFKSFPFFFFFLFFFLSFFVFSSSSSSFSILSFFPFGFFSCSYSFFSDTKKEDHLIISIASDSEGIECAMMARDESILPILDWVLLVTNWYWWNDYSRVTMNILGDWFILKSWFKWDDAY